MDAFALRRQLTIGARFTKKQPRNAKKPAADVKEPVKKEELASDVESEHGSVSKEEVVDEPDNAGFSFLDKLPQAKKKTKKVLSPEQIKAQQEEERVNRLRKEHRIVVKGKNIPAPIASFDDLAAQYKVLPQLVANLKAYNYPQPTAIQLQAMPIMLTGRPLMACAPTGSGKTLAFLTPLINDLRSPQRSGFRALIIAPTRELAHQIYRECLRLTEKTGLRLYFVSKVSEAKQKLGTEGGDHRGDILISTPNRIRFLLKREPPLLQLKSIEWLVLDEADRLLQDGPKCFKEQLDEIFIACTHPQRKLALFSATYTVPVAKWATRHLKNLARVTIGARNAATESVEQKFLFVGSEDGKLIEMRNIVREGLKPPVLVFVQSKERAKELFDELLYDGINVDVIHSDRTQHQRDNCVRAFREGNIWVLICTELMSRGIDFKGVNLVINYDFPPSPISYIHRIGRTGRAGRTGKAVTFFTVDDLPYLRTIAEVVKNSGGEVPEYMLNMDKTNKKLKKRLEKRPLDRKDICTKVPNKRERWLKWKKDLKNNKKANEDESTPPEAVAAKSHKLTMKSKKQGNLDCSNNKQSVGKVKKTTKLEPKVKRKKSEKNNEI